MSAPRSDARRRLLAVLTFERGALLWIPSLLAAAYLVLFAIRQAPTGVSLLSQTTALCLLVGPVEPSSGDMAAARDDLVRGLCRGLARRPALAVVAPQRLLQRIQVSHTAMPHDPAGWIRATRVFHASYFLQGSVEPAAEGTLSGRVEVWDVAQERPLFVFASRADRAERLGSALADSVYGVLFRPQPLKTAAAP